MKGDGGTMWHDVARCDTMGLDTCIYSSMFDIRRRNYTIILVRILRSNKMRRTCTDSRYKKKTFFLICHPTNGCTHAKTPTTHTRLACHMQYIWPAQYSAAPSFPLHHWWPTNNNPLLFFRVLQQNNYRFYPFHWLSTLPPITFYSCVNAYAREAFRYIHSFLFVSAAWLRTMCLCVYMAVWLGVELAHCAHRTRIYGIKCALSLWPRVCHGQPQQQQQLKEMKLCAKWQRRATIGPPNRMLLINRDWWL